MVTQVRLGGYLAKKRREFSADLAEDTSDSDYSLSEFDGSAAGSGAPSGRRGRGPLDARFPTAGEAGPDIMPVAQAAPTRLYAL